MRPKETYRGYRRNESAGRSETNPDNQIKMTWVQYQKMKINQWGSKAFKARKVKPGEIK